MDEELEVMAELSIPEEYSELDQYNDFRSVFLETDQGRRVLKLILSWGRVLKSHPVPPEIATRYEGRRELALRIFHAMLTEPKEKPQVQSRRPQQE